MAQRPENSRYARPIVPDPDASLSDHRLRHPPPPRLWPLWLLVLVLLLGGAALSAVGWLHYQRLQQQIARLGGEVSNVHARFDAEEGRGEALAAVEERLAALESLEEDLEQRREARLAAWREEHLAGLEENLEASRRVLDERLTRLAETAEGREATLSAVHASLDALERTGDEGRAALWEELATLQEAREGDLARREALEERLDGLASRLDERGARVEARLAEFDEMLSSLGDDVEGLSGSGQDARERIATLDDRLTQMQAELRELRQSQLALSAQVEMLRQ